MKRRMKMSSKIKSWFFGMVSLTLLLISIEKIEAEEVNLSGASSHIGTFEGSTTFVAMGSNGVHPELLIEVMDRYGKLTQYESKEGVISIPNTKEGAYVTQAKMLGKTKYRDLDTNELLDEWEDGRNLELVSVENPILTTTGKNLFDTQNASMKTSWWIGDTNGSGMSVQKDIGSTNYSILIPVESGHRYRISGENMTRMLYAFLDENYQTLFVGAASNTTVVAPEQTRYLLYYLNHINLDETTNIQVEVGEVATPYVAYQSSSLSMMSENLIDHQRTEPNCYYVWKDGTKDVSGGVSFNSLMANVEGLSKVYVRNGHSNYTFWDANMNYLSGVPYVDDLPSEGANWMKDGVVKVPKNAMYMKFAYGMTENNGSPHVGEGVTLHGVDWIKDELDLLTGELVQRIGEKVLDGSFDEQWAMASDVELTNTAMFMLDSVDHHVVTCAGVCDKFGYKLNWLIDEEGCYLDAQNYFCLRLKKSKLATITLDGFRQYLSQNPITHRYHLANESIKSVILNSTYTFGRVSMRDVYVNGKVKPLVCSVNVPTADLTFILDPNQKEGEQFIAPTFSLINETPTSIQVTLKSFEQETDVFNDVLPTTHDDWRLLDQEQSKDIALALVPKPSEGWVELNEGSYYVANHQSSLLGKIKGYSTVDLTFQAKHGRSFLEELNPSYKLVFIFDF